MEKGTPQSEQATTEIPKTYSLTEFLEARKNGSLEAPQGRLPFVHLTEKEYLGGCHPTECVILAELDLSTQLERFREIEDQRRSQQLEQWALREIRKLVQKIKSAIVKPR